MRKPISVERFRAAIRRLPSDRPIHRPGIWYRSQKEHWLGWLSEYHGPGYYGRNSDARRDARFAYNHFDCPQMLLWIARAARVPRQMLQDAKQGERNAETLPAKSAAIRRAIPWAIISGRLWGEGKGGAAPRLK
jgi:hypothetical protein